MFFTVLVQEDVNKSMLSALSLMWMQDIDCLSSFVLKNVNICFCIGAQHEHKLWGTLLKHGAVCSETPHLKFVEEARPYFCMDKWTLSLQLALG